MAMSPSSKLNLIKRLVLDCRLLASLIRDYIAGRYRNVSALSGLVGVLAAAYLFIPIDLVNDWIPGLGQLDDAAVLFSCLWFLEKDLYRYGLWKAENTMNSKSQPHVGKNRQQSPALIKEFESSAA